jgi:hypothetical protein
MTGPEKSTHTFSRRQRNQASRYVYSLLGVGAVMLLVMGTVAFHYMEGWSWVDSFYFSAVAGTTVGFGDLTPSTDLSKLFSVVYIFVGIGIIGTFLDQRLKYHGVVKRRTEKAISKAKEKNQA